MGTDMETPHRDTGFQPVLATQEFRETFSIKSKSRRHGLEARVTTTICCSEKLQRNTGPRPVHDAANFSESSFARSSRSAHVAEARVTLVVLLMLLSVFSVAKSAFAQTTKPVQEADAIQKTLSQSGELHDGTLTIRIPRSDLNVTVDGMDVPTNAGIESTFNFFRCECGKTKLTGQFCCADYEVNDVLSSINIGTEIQVVSVGPMFIHDRPRITLIRIQGEGEPDTLAKSVAGGLKYMGEARNAKREMEK